MQSARLLPQQPSPSQPLATEEAPVGKTRVKRSPTEKRLRLIAKRQANPTWDKDYIPSILAVRGEAPSISHALTITPEKLGRREVHLLSQAEFSAALLGLYHPGTVGLQEQRAFARTGCPHPLHNFKTVSPVGLRPLPSLVDTADRLGYLDSLSKVKIKDAATGNYRWVVFPFISDLLWAVCADDGHHYCLNWSIKDSEEAFKRPLESRRVITPKATLVDGVLVRHELERAYYQGAGIRTVFLAADTIDPHVSSNLRQLFLHHTRPISLSLSAQEDLIERYRNCIDSGTPTLQLIAKLTGAGRYSVDECRDVLYQAIWNRQLRVDLFHPILIDRPLHPETRDVITVYANWFSETEPC